MPEDQKPSSDKPGPSTGSERSPNSPGSGKPGPDKGSDRDNDGRTSR